MAPIRLPENKAVRNLLLGALIAVGTIFVTQLVLPGAAGGGRGTPGAVLFTGVVYGLVNALTATGIILIYRTTRVINFAQTAIGAAGAELVFQFLLLTNFPFVPALLLGLALAAFTGFAFELVLRRFFAAPRLVLTTATIAGAGATVILRDAVNKLPFFPQFRTFADITRDLRGELPFSGFRFTVGSSSLPFGMPEVLAIQLSIVAIVVVVLFFRFTKAGVAVRALAENAERASLLGISTGNLSSIVWTFAGLLSGISVFLAGALDNPASAGGVAPGVLLPALAAATLGRFQSLPRTIAAAVGISIVSRAIVFSFRDDRPLVNVALFLIVAVGLLLQRRAFGRSEVGGGVSWKAVDEQRSVPRELEDVSTVRIAKVILIAIGVAIVVVYPFLVSTGAINLGGVVALSTILALSMVVLTGWAGQVSLGQWGFASVGAVVGGALMERVGLPFFLAIPLATVVSAAFAVVVGIPALRIKGLFLAVTTFMFAYAINGVLFNRRYFGWLLPNEVERPSLLLLDFEEERSMYFLCVLSLALVLVVMRNLRRGRFGRTIIAIRENEANVQSFGIGLVRTKLLAFAVSGGMAGFAGAIYGIQQRGLSAESFSATKSLDLFLLVIVGGVSSAGGALLGSGVFSVTDYFFPTNVIVQFFKPFLVFLILFASPGGLIAVLISIRDAALRIIAQRRQIVVPSLFADFDPELLARRLIPLAEPSADSGLNALPAEERFAKASELYQGRGTRFMEKLEAPKVNRETAAIGAAAARAAEDEAVGAGAVVAP
jgi:branched-chain amino acid transport system permease protein